MRSLKAPKQRGGYLDQLGATATGGSRVELRVEQKPFACERQSSSFRAHPLQKLRIRLDVAAVELGELGVGEVAVAFR